MVAQSPILPAANRTRGVIKEWARGIDWDLADNQIAATTGADMKLVRYARSNYGRPSRCPKSDLSQINPALPPVVRGKPGPKPKPKPPKEYIYKSKALPVALASGVPDGAVAIPLRNCFYALVDAADFDAISRHPWSVRVAQKLAYAWSRRDDGRPVLMHRLIMDPPDDMDVDHINGNGLDNRRSNLRVCTRSQNLGNRRISDQHAFKGICRETRCNRWFAVCAKKRLGNFATAEEAARAYDRAALARWGEFARTNFPREQYAPVAANG